MTARAFRFNYKLFNEIVTRNMTYQFYELIGVHEHDYILVAQENGGPASHNYRYISYEEYEEFHKSVYTNDGNILSAIKRFTQIFSHEELSETMELEEEKSRERMVSVEE